MTSPWRGHPELVSGSNKKTKKAGVGQCHFRLLLNILHT